MVDKCLFGAELALFSDVSTCEHHWGGGLAHPQMARPTPELLIWGAGPSVVGWGCGDPTWGGLTLLVGDATQCTLLGTEWQLWCGCSKPHREAWRPT